MNHLLLFSLHPEQEEEMDRSGAAARIENRLIRASAGTGKTYHLTSRYLQLLLAGAPPDSILATTFTRKAAGEILERVMVRLAKAAADPLELKELAEAVERPDLTGSHCRETLGLLTRQPHRLRIHTLDAFFMQIALSFSLELGLTPGWQVVEEGAASDRLQNEAIAGVLAADSLPDLLTLVHQLLPKGEAQRSLAGMLRLRAGEAYRLYLDSLPQAWDMIHPPPPLAAAELEELVQAIGDLELRTETMRAARAADLDRILAENWKGFLDGGPTLVKPIMEDCEKYRNSKIPPDLRALYQRFLPHLRAMVLQSARAQTRGTYEFLTKYHDQLHRLKASQRLYEFDDITRILAEQTQTRALHSFAFRMDAGIDHLLLDEFQDTSIAQWQVLTPLVERSSCDQPGRSFFCVGDVKQAIYGWRGGSSEIFELLDKRLPNLTNSELLESRRSSQVVIDSVNRVFEFLPTWEKLRRGQRAARQWEFPRHTTVHQDLPGHVTLETAAEGPDEKKETQEAEVLRRAASRVASLVARAPGRTIGILCRRNKMVARMMHELQREGIPASEEGGNVLTDSAAVELVLSLLHLADHPSDSVAAFHVVSSPWGQTMDWRLEPVRVSNQAAEPAPAGDTRRLGGVPIHDQLAARGTSELDTEGEPPLDARDAASSQTSPVIHPAAGKPQPGAGRRVARQVRRQLLDDGFGATLQNWADQLRPFCNRREARRLGQLVEIAHEYQARLESPRQLGFDRQSRISIRPSEFVRFVRASRVADPSADAVRVMTVHQAKGLQFDVVILPDLLGPLVEGQDTFLYRRPSIEGKVDLVCRYLGKDSGRAFLPSSFLPLFDQHEDRRARESLCVLYVAMTRAKHALHMIVPSTLPMMKNTKESPAYLLKDALSGGGQLAPATTIYEAGQPRWFEMAEIDMQPARQRPIGGRPNPKLAPSAGRQPRYLETASPSERAADGVGVLRDRLAPSNARARAYGILLHEWLRHIEWLDERQSGATGVSGRLTLANAPPGSDSESRLRALAEPYASQLDIDQAICRFQQLMTCPPLTDLLSRKSYLLDLRGRLPNLPDRIDLEVRTEQRVMGRAGATVIGGTIDRLVLIRAGGRLVAADIIDFKTDAIDCPEAMAAKESAYGPQLEAYRRVISSSLRLDRDWVTSKIAFLGWEQTAS